MERSSIGHWLIGVSWLGTACIDPIRCEDTLTCPHTNNAEGSDQDAGSTVVIPSAVSSSLVADSVRSSALLQDGGSEDAGNEAVNQVPVEIVQAKDAGSPASVVGSSSGTATEATATSSGTLTVPSASLTVPIASASVVFTTPNSCSKITLKCGIDHVDSCCTSLPIEGGTFLLGDIAYQDTTSNATVSAFALDKYEVTVARFRQFIDAYSGPPASGAGTHPLNSASGWNSSWNVEMPVDRAALSGAVNCEQTIPGWVPKIAGDELPMNCVTWYEAFAFCVWDGGWLPTEAEWEYAAAGGGEDRAYPWGSAAPTTMHAVYGCTADGSTEGVCTPDDILPAGSKPKGVGKYGHLDLAGSMSEWTLDIYAEFYLSPCKNCSNLSSEFANPTRVVRGGSWNYSANSLAASLRDADQPQVRYPHRGFRCARKP
jgi:formylglycine-generating enzyme